MGQIDKQGINTTTTHRSLLGALALSSGTGMGDIVDFASQRRQVAAGWPIALIVQICAAVTLGYVARISGNPDSLLRVVIVGALLVVTGSVALAILTLRPMRDWPARQHIRVAIGYGAAQASLLMLMLWDAGILPLGRGQLAAFVAVACAIGITATVLNAMRAALFVYAAALWLMLWILSGFGTGTQIGLGCLIALAIAIRHLAMLDLQHAHADFDAYGSGRLAARLVHEFELQGTGWFWQTDSEGQLIYLSDKVAEVLSEPNLPAIGRPLTALLQMDGAAPGTERTLGFHMSSRTGFSDYTVRPVKLATIDRWWSISGRPVLNAAGRFQGFVGSGADLTEKRRADAEITRLALFDGLTGLANRQRMRVSLDQSLNQPNVPYRPTAMFLLDLDRFKVVNDTLGHQVGDALLKQVAQRLMRSIGDAGLVGRLGGDEFQVVLPGESNTTALSDLARTVIASLSQPYSIDGATVTIGCSIGVAIAPTDGGDSETLIRNADLALYAAKADGRGIHRFYREELLHGAQNRKQLEDDLRHALVQNQLHLVYQPVVCTKSARIMGYEALLRWEHPTRGYISPADFVPVAEDCGLIETIGEWVLRTACLDAALWPKHIRVAVNVSPIQFANPALPAIVTNALAKSGIAPGRLELEITEGVFLDESASSDQMFKTLHGLGVRLALDDFGTGYSSLAYLKNAPFDKIKIDQSFVRGAAIPGSRNTAIIRAIVTLAETLGMETTAEGVEAQDEIQLIRELGCSHIQGFVYGKPARLEDVLESLKNSDGIAKPQGFKVSRNQRSTMMRTAMLEVEGARGEVRIRNISSTGAMIDGIEFGRNVTDLDLLIELIEGQMFPAKVRWSKDGKAGIEFAENFNLERLMSPADQARLSKTG
ncbi:MAG: EAL domain-containing protein [Sphingomonas sp.]